MNGLSLGSNSACHGQAMLTRRPDPCRGIVGRRVVPLSRSASNARLSRRDPHDARLSMVRLFGGLRVRGGTLDELRDAIALLFKRKGRDELSEREFVLSASMDLRWFPPRDAQRLLQIGLETKLLESHEGTIRPGFDVSSVDVPRDSVP